MNIFGGIIRCDEIAKGIIAAAQESNLVTPIVVRLQGNCMNSTKRWYKYNHVSLFHLEGGYPGIPPRTNSPSKMFSLYYIAKYTDAKIYIIIIKLRLGD